MYRVIFLFFILIASLNAKNMYKVEQIKDFLSCLTPYVIEDLNSVYIKDDKNQVIYKISLDYHQGKCTWKRDKLFFRVGIVEEDYQKIIADHNIQIYLDTTFNPYFIVEKLNNDDTLVGKKITIPYFTILNNGDNILEQVDNYITIKLPKKTETVLKGPSISFNNKFNKEDYINLEIISGIYIND